ncbi:hypothetical protein ACGFJ7_21150 [Actinoplanes sp. NPDC048988]|uniref:hypothetical protein n=1 Tax=Actinoplanes sp. NPDC048988 TaxID=3363901 RepID=UPI0037192E92
MARQQWGQLPAALRNVITAHIGPVEHVQEAGAGSNADFAATLTARGAGRIFCKGVWLDTARMLVRLVHAGHTPAQAESWAAALPTWAGASPEAVDAFAAALAKLSRKLKDETIGSPHLAEMAAASDSWLRYREGVSRLRSRRLPRR